MANAARGDREAAQRVFRALWPPVSALCSRMLAAEPESDDAAQRALMKLFEASANFDAQGDVMAWAFAIAAWECRSIKRRRRAFEPVPASLAAEHSPEDALFQRELEAEARSAFGLLSAADRATLAEALSDDPRAALASAAFRKRKQRALERLRHMWRSRHGDA